MVLKGGSGHWLDSPLRLADYLSRVSLRPDNHHRSSFKLFGHLFNFGYSALAKKEAAKALKAVLLEGADKACLKAHQGALTNGQLKKIYRPYSI